MKICFLIPDGVGIRNYLYSDLLWILHQKGHQVVIWHALDQKVVELASTINGFTPQQATFTSCPEDFIIQKKRQAFLVSKVESNLNYFFNVL